MRLFVTFFVTFLTLTAFSQSSFTPVDRKIVEQAVKDSSQSTYYPKLVSRLKSFDTTLSKQEYRLLYYGFVFQSGYSPYGSDKSTEINTAFDKGDYDAVIKYCDEIISKNPVSLRNYYYKCLALSKKGNDSLLQKNRHLYSSIIDAIISSGDGLACNTAFKVISVSDEYDVMYRYFEIEQVKSQSLQTPCDKMNIKPSQYFTKTNIYFDVSESLRSMQNMFK